MEKIEIELYVLKRNNLSLQYVTICSLFLVKDSLLLHKGCLRYTPNLIIESFLSMLSMLSDKIQETFDCEFFEYFNSNEVVNPKFSLITLYSFRQKKAYTFAGPSIPNWGEG